MRAIHSAPLLTLLVALPACSSSSAHPIYFAPDDTGSVVVTDGGVDATQDSSLADVGLDATHPDADGATAPDGHTDAADVGADVGADVFDVNVTPLCPKAYSDVPTTAVGYPHDPAGERLAGITWDELTMAWTTTDTAGVVTVHYGDRAGRDATFGTIWTLPTSLGPFPDESVGLTADGLTMIVASADHKTVRQLTRTARGVPFDAATATSAPFVHLMGDPLGSVTKLLGDLVISKDGQWLFYSDLSQASGSTILLSARLADGTWDGPTPLTASRLQMSAGFRKRPTGVSSDNLTLFYLDDASQTTLVAFRIPGTKTFTEFYAYAPSGILAKPTDACDRVYMSAVKPRVLSDSGVPNPKPDAGPDGSVTAATEIVRAP